MPSDSNEVPVFGHQYKIGRMNAIQQFHVMRRLGGVAGSLGEAFSQVQRLGGAASVEKMVSSRDAAKSGDVLRVIEPVLLALGAMRDEDVNYVLHNCLSVVERQQSGGGGWARVMPQPGVIMFMDIEMPQMLAITWHVLRSNLANFFFDLLSGLTALETTEPGSSSSAGSATGS